MLLPFLGCRHRDQLLRPELDKWTTRRQSGPKVDVKLPVWPVTSTQANVIGTGYSAALLFYSLTWQRFDNGAVAICLHADHPAMCLPSLAPDVSIISSGQNWITGQLVDENWPQLHANAALGLPDGPATSKLPKGISTLCKCQAAAPSFGYNTATTMAHSPVAFMQVSYFHHCCCKSKNYYLIPVSSPTKECDAVKLVFLFQRLVRAALLDLLLVLSG